MIKLTSIATSGGGDVELIGLTMDGEVVTIGGDYIALDIDMECTLYDEYGEDLGVSSIREALEYYDHFTHH